jgi:predicted RNA-binding protein YlqC (UPF0109 family)
MSADERDQRGPQENVEEIGGTYGGEEAVSEDTIDQVMGEAAADGESSVEQLRTLVVWLIDQLVDEPESVRVDAVDRGSSVQIQVRLPEADLGKLIGRGGRIAKSIRTALMIAGSRHHVRVSLDIEGQE